VSVVSLAGNCRMLVSVLTCTFGVATENFEVEMGNIRAINLQIRRSMTNMSAPSVNAVGKKP